MRFVVAGAVALFTALIALLSYYLIGIKNAEKSECDSEEKHPSRSKRAAIMLLMTTKRLSLSQWLFIGLCAVLNGLATVRLVTVETDKLACARIIVALVFLFGALLVDWNTKTIPNVFVIAMLIIGAVIYGIHFFADIESFKIVILSALIGSMGNLLLFYVMSRLTKDGIGMGDVKLISALGWLTGFKLTFLTVLFGLIICSVFAVFLLFSKKKNAKDSVPFGPFIYFGSLISLLLCNF